VVCPFDTSILQTLSWAGRPSSRPRHRTKAADGISWQVLAGGKGLYVITEPRHRRGTGVRFRPLLTGGSPSPDNGGRHSSIRRSSTDADFLFKLFVVHRGLFFLGCTAPSGGTMTTRKDDSSAFSRKSSGAVVLCQGRTTPKSSRRCRSSTRRSGRLYSVAKKANRRDGARQLSGHRDQYTKDFPLRAAVAFLMRPKSSEKKARNVEFAHDAQGEHAPVRSAVLLETGPAAMFISIWEQTLARINEGGVEEPSRQGEQTLARLIYDFARLGCQDQRRLPFEYNSALGQIAPKISLDAARAWRAGKSCYVYQRDILRRRKIQAAWQGQSRHAGKKIRRSTPHAVGVLQPEAG